MGALTASRRVGKSLAAAFDLPSLGGACALLVAAALPSILLRHCGPAGIPPLSPVRAAGFGVAPLFVVPLGAFGANLAATTLFGLLLAFGLLGSKYPASPALRWAPVALGALAGLSWGVSGSSDRFLQGYGVPMALVAWGAVAAVLILQFAFLARAQDASPARWDYRPTSTCLPGRTQALTLSVVLALLTPLAALRLELVALRPSVFPEARISDLAAILVLQFLAASPRPFAAAAMRLAQSAPYIPFLLYAVPTGIGTLLLSTDLLFSTAFGVAFYLGITDYDFLEHPHLWSRAWAWCDGTLLLMIAGVALFGGLQQVRRVLPSRVAAILAPAGPDPGRQPGRAGISGFLRREIADHLTFLLPGATLLFFGRHLAYSLRATLLALTALIPWPHFSSWLPEVTFWFSPLTWGLLIFILILFPYALLYSGVPSFRALRAHGLSTCLFGVLIGLSMKANPGSWEPAGVLSFLAFALCWLGASLFFPFQRFFRSVFGSALDASSLELLLGRWRTRGTVAEGTPVLTAAGESSSGSRATLSRGDAR